MALSIEILAGCETGADPARGARWSRRFRPWLLAVGIVCAATGPASGAAPAARGTPFTRSYSYEDIGNVPRGSRLGFDRFGRLAVIHDAVYSVLNDSVWLNLAEQGGPGRVSMANVVQGLDGRSYYGARAAWGYVEFGADGRLHPIPLTPENPPGWVSTALFRDVIVTPAGVFFSSWNGVAYWDFQRRTNVLFEVPRLSRTFLVGDRVYVSAFDQPLHYIDTKAGVLVPAAGTELDREVVEHSTPLDAHRSLLALVDGGLVVFDGEHVSPWLAPGNNFISGDISVVQQLVDGRIALGVTGQGILLASPEGELLMALRTPEYRNITALANREPGVLWVETEHAIEKVFYDGPLSAFDQRLGLPTAWPIVGLWKNQIVVASDGKLYRAINGAAGEPTYFEPTPTQPPGGAWALAAWGDRLLAGSGSGLYSAGPDGVFRPLPSVGDLAHLVMTDDSHCFVIGRAEIALLEWRDGEWVETVPRIPGVSNPAIVHRVKNSVWIEMGGGGVARLWRDGGRLRLDVVPNESWTKGSWVNIGALDDIVILSATREEPRRFFNQQTGAWVEAPELQRLLERSPYWIARLQKDANGVIWATHNEGLIRFTPDGRDYDMDTSSFDLVNDRYPVVRVLPNNDVWMAAERSLYHVERNWMPASSPAKPTLVSVVDHGLNQELLTGDTTSSLQLPYSRNSLSFRFYSGTDAWRRAPTYEYRLSEREPWIPFDGSLLSFRGLREGSYRLEVRAAGVHASEEVSAPFVVEVLPPWHRSLPAYLVFGSLGILALFGTARGLNYLERRRNRRLEELVHERTLQLEEAMARLGDETRNAATLAERDRLASEIHDSVQQGLTGAILQLDSTLKIPAVDADVRSRLSVVRNMVSYARQEVEHAVWDMESPLLDGTELADALRNLTAFVNSGEVAVDISVTGQAIPLGRTISHNLLRIAQEATTNAFRHARAGRITIRLDYRPDSIAMHIADDGVGFRPDDVLQSGRGHLGLPGMRARAKKLRGTFEIVSAPGQGTSLRIEVPILENQNAFLDTEAHSRG